MRAVSGIALFLPVRGGSLPCRLPLRHSVGRGGQMYREQSDSQEAFSRCRSRFLSFNRSFTLPFLPEPRKAFTGSAGKGITLAVVPSTTHSRVVSGPIWSFFRTSDGTETCPRFVTLVRIVGIMQDRWRIR